MKRKHPHLIFIDLYMLEMNGFEFLENIKSNQKLSDIPVIVAPGKGDTGARERAFRLGADDFITKDISEEELVPRVRKHIV